MLSAFEQSVPLVNHAAWLGNHAAWLGNSPTMHPLANGRMIGQGWVYWPITLCDYQILQLIWCTVGQSCSIGQIMYRGRLPRVKLRIYLCYAIGQYLLLWPTVHHQLHGRPINYIICNQLYAIGQYYYIGQSCTRWSTGARLTNWSIMLHDWPMVLIRQPCVTYTSSDIDACTYVRKISVLHAHITAVHFYVRKH